MSDRPGPFDPADDASADDQTARRLREVLAREARAITPSADGLAMIREKIRAQRPTRRNWVRAFQIGGAGLATAAVAIIGVIAVQHKPGSTNHPAAATAAASSASPSPTAPIVPPATPAASSAPASSAPSSYPVWIYYVDKRKDPQQLLFRERVIWPASPQHTFVKDAVSAMLATPPQDPDYTSYWPAGTTLLSANIVGGTTAVVNLSSEASDGSGEGSSHQRAAAALHDHRRRAEDRQPPAADRRRTGDLPVGHPVTTTRPRAQPASPAASSPAGPRSLPHCRRGRCGATCGSRRPPRTRPLRRRSRLAARRRCSKAPSTGRFCATAA